MFEFRLDMDGLKLQATASWLVNCIAYILFQDTVLDSVIDRVCDLVLDGVLVPASVQDNGFQSPTHRSYKNFTSRRTGDDFKNSGNFLIRHGLNLQALQKPMNKCWK